MSFLFLCLQTPLWSFLIPVMKGWELGILECQGKTSEMMVEWDGLQGSSSSNSQFQATRIHQPCKGSDKFKVT